MMQYEPADRGGRLGLVLVVGVVIGCVVGAASMYFLKRGKSGSSGLPNLGEAKELALVPPDAGGFIHIRIRDIWKLDTFSTFRKAVEKAGPDALKTLDEGFTPAPSTLDRMTVVFFGREAGQAANAARAQALKGPGGVQVPFDPYSMKTAVILAFSEPFDAAKVRRAYMPNVSAKTIDGKEVWLDPAQDLGLYFHDDKVMVFGTAVSVEHFIHRQKNSPAEGPLSPALKVATEGKRHLAAGLNIWQFEMQDLKFDRAEEKYKALQADFRNVLKADAVAFSAAFSSEAVTFEVRAPYKTDTDAGVALAAIRKIAEVTRSEFDVAKKHMKAMVNGRPDQPNPRPLKDLPDALLGLMGLGAINMLDEHLVNPPVKVDGKELVATIEFGSSDMMYTTTILEALRLAGTPMHTFQSGPREVAGAPDTQPQPTPPKPQQPVRNVTHDNLKLIGQAVSKFVEANKKLPPRAWTQTATEAKPGGLSWRVHLLPYLDEQALYEQFKLDEPWDSEHNKKLISKMPKVYTNPRAPLPGMTYYKVAYGPGTVFDDKAPVETLEGITDGPANTVLIMECGDPATWTKPEDLKFDPAKPQPELRLNGSPKIHVLMFDGNVRVIDVTRVKPETLKAVLTPAGGEVLGSDW